MNEIENKKKNAIDAVTKNGLLLKKYLSKYDYDFDRDFEITLAAVNQNGLALQFAINFRSNSKIIYAALNSDLASRDYALMNSSALLRVVKKLEISKAFYPNDEKKLHATISMIFQNYFKSVGILDKEHEIAFKYDSRDVYHDIAINVSSYLSIKELGLFTQLSTNLFVETVSSKNEIYFRPPHSSDPVEKVSRFIVYKDFHPKFRFFIEAKYKEDNMWKEVGESNKYSAKIIDEEPLSKNTN